MPVATVTNRSLVILCKVYILSPEISGLIADCMAFSETINYMAFFSWRVFFLLWSCAQMCVTAKCWLGHLSDDDVC